MNDERLREAYQRGLPRGDNRPPLDDLASERIRRLVDQEGPEEERLHTVDGLLSTAAGRADLDIAWAAAQAARPARRRRLGWGLAAAAVLAVAIPTALLVTGDDGPPVLRGEGSPIALVAPLGTRDAEAATRFVWRALAGVERYTVIVVDTTGQDIFVSETADTAVQLPDSIRLVPGTTYLWWVQARSPTGEVVTGLTERLSIAPE